MLNDDQLTELHALRKLREEEWLDRTKQARLNVLEKAIVRFAHTENFDQVTVGDGVTTTLSGRALHSSPFTVVYRSSKVIVAQKDSVTFPKDLVSHLGAYHVSEGDPGVIFSRNLFGEIIVLLRKVYRTGGISVPEWKEDGHENIDGYFLSLGRHYAYEPD